LLTNKSHRLHPDRSWVSNTKIESVGKAAERKRKGSSSDDAANHVVDLLPFPNAMRALYYNNPDLPEMNEGDLTFWHYCSQESARPEKPQLRTRIGLSS